MAGRIIILPPILTSPFKLLFCKMLTLEKKYPIFLPMSFFKRNMVAHTVEWEVYNEYVYFFRRWLLSLFARKRPHRSTCQSSCPERSTPSTQLADIVMWYELFTQKNDISLFPLSTIFFWAFSSGIRSKWTYVRKNNGRVYNSYFPIRS